MLYTRKADSEIVIGDGKEGKMEEDESENQPNPNTKRDSQVKHDVGPSTCVRKKHNISSDGYSRRKTPNLYHRINVRKFRRKFLRYRQKSDLTVLTKERSDLPTSSVLTKERSDMPTSSVLTKERSDLPTSTVLTKERIDLPTSYFNRDIHGHRQVSTVSSEPYNVSASGFIVTSPSDDTSEKHSISEMMEIHEKQNGSKKTEHRKIQSYKMTSEGGLVLILNNEYYTNCEGRPGSQFDVQKLNELFKNLGCLVYTEQNQTAEEMEGFLYEVSKFKNFGEVNSLIVVVMSHGCDGYILGKDGSKLEVNKFVKLFDSDSCPGLKGKPKMFIINACRGGDVSFDKTLPCYDRCNTDGGITTLFPERPPHTDFVLAYSTFPGNPSYRNEQEGSWYIQCLVEVFQEMAAEEHVIDMLTEVTKRVADKSENDKGFKQTPFTSSSLVKKWFL